MARPLEPGHLWFATIALAVITALQLISDPLLPPWLPVSVLALLPAVLVHLTLVFPHPLPIVWTYPGIVWVAYAAAAVPAAIALRAAATSPDARQVLLTLSISLSCIVLAAMILRLGSVAIGSTDRGEALSTRFVLVALGISLLGCILRKYSEAFEWSISAFPVAIALVGPALRWRIGSASEPRQQESGSITLDQITRGMAHAMRKPLDLASDRLTRLEQTVADTTQKQHAFEALQLVGRVQEFVEAVLTLARGQKAPQRRRMSIKSLGKQAASDVLARFPSANIELNMGEDYLLGDEVSLRCLLVNLLENALEAASKPGWASLTSAASGDSIRIEVEDRSGGLPDEVQDRLFEPFLTTKPEGIGLGLVTVREICRAHGGSVEAIVTDRGTRFVILLPADPS